MVKFILLGTLAAFGALSVVWCLLGWLLPKAGGRMLCLPGTEEQLMIHRYLWLRSMGIVSVSLIIVDREMDETERNWLVSQGIEIWSRGEIASRFGIGAEDIDGTGNGDHPGCHQRRGISEL